MRTGRSARCARALHGAGNAPTSCSPAPLLPHPPRPRRASCSLCVCWISSPPGTRYEDSIQQQQQHYVHPPLLLSVERLPVYPGTFSFMQASSSSNSQLRRIVSHAYAYSWHMQADAETWINISPSLLNENINWQLFSAASICTELLM